MKYRLILYIILVQLIFVLKLCEIYFQIFFISKNSFDLKLSEILLMKLSIKKRQLSVVCAQSVCADTQFLKTDVTIESNTF